MIRHCAWYVGIVVVAGLLSDLIAPAPHRVDPWASFALHHPTHAATGSGSVHWATPLPMRPVDAVVATSWSTQAVGSSSYGVGR